jgi:branched-chain amino acid transport system permease protein
MNMGYSILFGILLAVGVNALFGLIAIRATGVSFLMITLAFGEIIHATARYWVTLTKGMTGITGIPPISIFGFEFNAYQTPIRSFYLVLVVFGVLFWIMFKLNRSSFAVAFRGTAKASERMTSLGYSVFWLRYIAFVICGFYAAVSGILFVSFDLLINSSALDIGKLMTMLMFGILGGVISPMGPAVGVIVGFLLERFIEPLTQRYLIVVGLIFLTAILFYPDGIMGWVESQTFYQRFLAFLGFRRSADSG